MIVILQLTYSVQVLLNNKLGVWKIPAHVKITNYHVEVWEGHHNQFKHSWCAK